MTKQLVTQKFFLGESISVIPGLFSLTYVRNPGAAFGMLARWDSTYRVPFFILVPLIALGVIGYLFHKVHEKDIKMAVALSLVIGGAVGNLIDRAAYNYVIDFLDFHWGTTGPHFPAFNVADSSICVGMGLLILDLFQKEKQQQQKELQADVSRIT